ncbi:hypothetical protein K458DRAFT_282565, partial [Lentithecium fluviatile CBS 122367]
PMGFAGQLKALERQHQDLIEIIDVLKSSLDSKDTKISELVARVDALERANQALNARRREAVAQLLNLRTRHQEAANAFVMRTSDIQEGDLEGVIVAWGTTINTVMNHQSMVLRRAAPPGAQPAYAPQPVAQVYYAYPTGYSATGWCVAHKAPYPCRSCG